MMEREVRILRTLEDGSENIIKIEADFEVENGGMYIIL